MKKEVERMERLRKLFVSRLRKYADMIEHPTGLDEMSLRRSAHRMWVHLTIIRRMYARSIETLYDYVWQALRKIERARMIWEPDDFKQEEYETWTKILFELGELRRQNGNCWWILNTISRASELPSEAELQIALSVPSVD